MVSARERRTPFAISGYIVLLLDLKTLRDELLHDLAARHFGEDYNVTVVDGSGKAFLRQDPRARRSKSPTPAESY